MRVWNDNEEVILSHSFNTALTSPTLFGMLLMLKKITLYWFNFTLVKKQYMNPTSFLRNHRLYKFKQFNQLGHRKLILQSLGITALEEKRYSFFSQLSLSSNLTSSQTFSYFSGKVHKQLYWRNYQENLKLVNIFPALSWGAIMKMTEETSGPTTSGKHGGEDLNFTGARDNFRLWRSHS